MKQMITWFCFWGIKGYYEEYKVDGGGSVEGWVPSAALPRHLWCQGWASQLRGLDASHRVGPEYDVLEIRTRTVDGEGKISRLLAAMEESCTCGDSGCRPWGNILRKCTEEGVFTLSSLFLLDLWQVQFQSAGHEVGRILSLLDLEQQWLHQPSQHWVSRKIDHNPLFDIIPSGWACFVL